MFSQRPFRVCNYILTFLNINNSNLNKCLKYGNLAIVFCVKYESFIKKNTDSFQNFFNEKLNTKCPHNYFI